MHEIASSFEPAVTHSRPLNIVSPDQTHRRTRALYARYASPNFRSR